MACAAAEWRSYLICSDWLLAHIPDAVNLESRVITDKLTTTTRGESMDEKSARVLGNWASGTWLDWRKTLVGGRRSCALPDCCDASVDPSLSLPSMN